jgi:hypothetical protein
MQAGFASIGLVGVYGWQVANLRPRALLAELVAVAWAGRRVWLVFDSDRLSKSGVLWAEWHLAGVLAGHGAAVKVVCLPEGPAGEDGKPVKVGADDFLVARGAEAFQELVALGGHTDEAPAAQGQP